LGSVDRLHPAVADPLFHFVHAPEATHELARSLPRWRAALEADGWQVEIQSLCELMWQVVDASERWDAWLETEPDATTTEILEAVRDALRTKAGAASAGLAPAILERVTCGGEARLLILTDAGLLHPFFRVRTIESLVHDRVASPTVLLYPGTRHGQFGLRFLGFYAEDANYRSTIIGGDA
jgi:hypothetical protein